MKAKRTSLVTMLLASAAIAKAADCQRVKFFNPAATGDDRFGQSVAIDGDTLVIGAPSTDTFGNNVGVVFMSNRNTGLWGPLEVLSPGDPNLGVVAGRAISIDRDRLAISLAHSFAEIWEKDGASGWSPVVRFANNDPCCTFYGESIGLFRNVLAVGAPYDNSGRVEGGSVYVYERDAGGDWSQTAELWPADVFPMDRFGLSVAVGRNRIVAGAPEDDDLGFASGSVYVFDKDPNTGWFEAAKLLPSDGGTQHVFGAAVAVAGDTILVGAPSSNTAATSAGEVYVFREVGPGVWLETQRLFASDAAAGDRFGNAIDLDGDIAVIGARSANTASEPDVGAAYVFHRQPNETWIEAGKIIADDAEPFAEFGNAVAVSGTTAIIGAWRDDEATVDSGSAYVFRVGPDADGDGVMDACKCPGDLTGDFTIELADLAIQLAHYGTLTGAQPEDGDLDADGDVDLADLAALLAAFGTGCQ